MSEELLPGLRRALRLCRLVDLRQAQDGLIREAVDCSDVIQREIDTLVDRHSVTHLVFMPD